MTNRALKIGMVLMLMVAAAISAEKLNDIGRPERNILTKENRNAFVFTAHPQPQYFWGQASNVGDGRQSLKTADWPRYGVQNKASSDGICFIQVDLKRPQTVRAFAVTGHLGGNYKPIGRFYLEGSMNGADWKMVGIGKSSQWHAPGTYPFVQEQIIPAIYPDKYRYYRVIAMKWTNGYMLVFNWGLFV